jgi:hypothetical protein
MRSRALGAIVPLLVLLAVPASAQVRQAELAGTVTDASGAVLPGVIVSAIFVATKETRTAVTDGEGKYRFNVLPVGVYTVQAELTGFSTVQYEEVRLAIGQSAILDLKMQVATLGEMITVKGESPLIDTTKSDLGGNIDEMQVKELPVIGRNWLGFAVLAPGMKSDGAEGAQDGPPAAGIGHGRQSKVYLDGADLMNRSTASNVDIRISNEVIGEFEVVTNRFDATMGQSGTAVVNAISKSGTDQFRGNTYFYLRDGKLNARDFFTNTKPPFRNEQYGGTIGGPVVRGNDYFFFNYERQREPKTVSANTGFPALDAEVDSSDTRNLLFGRYDHALSQDHRLSGKFNYYTRLQPHAGTGGGTVPSNSLLFDWKIKRYNVALNSVFASKWVNTVTFAMLDTQRLFGKIPEAGAGHSFPSVYVGGSSGGGFEDPSYWTARTDTAVFFDKAGQHNVKFGLQGEYGVVLGHFDFYSNGIFFYGQDPPNLATCCGSDDQSTWDKSQFPIPTRYTQALGDLSINAPNKVFSAYVQDDWAVSSRLSLNLGVRYDVEFGSLGNRISGLVQQPFDNDIDNIQPRLGFAYDLTGDKKTVLRGGGGLFYSQVFLNVTFYVERTNHVRQLTVNVVNSNNDPNFIRDPLRGQTFEDFESRIGSPEYPLDVDVLPPGTKQPHLWSGSLGIQREITPQLAVSADYVFSTTDSQLRSIDTNLFCCLADGNARPVYDGVYPELGGFVAGAGRPDPRFNNIRHYVTSGRADYHGLQVALDKRWRQNYQFGLTYLLSENKDDLGQTGAQSFPSNQFNLADEYGTSVFDQRHRFTGNWIVKLPYDVTFSGLMFAASGQARVATVGGKDIFGIAPVGQNTGARPTCGRDPQFNPGCQVLGIPNGQRVPVNPLRSEPVFRVDVRGAKTFRLGGRAELTPTLEVFNLLNRNNHDPATINTVLSSASFGRPGRSSSLPYLPRQIQLGARFAF